MATLTAVAMRPVGSGGGQGEGRRSAPEACRMPPGVSTMRRHRITREAGCIWCQVMEGSSASSHHTDTMVSQAITSIAHPLFSSVHLPAWGGGGAFVVVFLLKSV